MEQEIIGYELTPLTKGSFTGMQVASGTSCFISKKGIAGCGHKLAISKEVFEYLYDNKEIKDLIKQEVYFGTRTNK